MSSIRSEVIRILNEYFSESKKISELVSADPLSGSDYFEIVQDGSNKKATISQIGSSGSGIGYTTVVTTGGTVTLDFGSNSIMVFKTASSISTPKIIATTDDGNKLKYDFIVVIDDVAGTLEFGAGVVMVDPRWDAGTEIWTPDGEGTFWFTAVWDSDTSTWFIKCVESIYA